jgi:benzoylformate decarboxylase
VREALPPRPEPPPLDPPAPGEPLRAGHVLAALAARLPRDVVLLEESPSSRPELQRRLPAREPLGFLSAAMGGLGFALPAAIGLRMALPDRPVLAVVGDGSSLYTIQSLWSAARYRVGALFVVLSNGRYAVMDRLAEMAGKSGPWPAFDLDVSALARTFGCEAVRVEQHADLISALDRAVPELAKREQPLLIEAVVAPDPSFEA